MKITKAVIAAAGYGTRFLPATKVQPKEMLPVIDKPVIQYLVEEAVASGIKTVIIVTRAGSHIMEDHFDSSFELEVQLKNANKKELLKKVKRIPKLADFVYLRQTKEYPYGNAVPLLVAQNLIAKGEHFVYMFGDDLVKAEVPATKQMIDLWKKNPQSVVVATQEVPEEEVSRYGIVRLKKGSENRVEGIIEKPEPDKAPSNLAQFGRFILNRRLVDSLTTQKTGKGGELWLADAIANYAQKYPVLAARIKGKWLTTGDPLRFLKTIIEFALDRPDLKKELKKYLVDLDL